MVEELEVIPVSSLAEGAAIFAGHLDIDSVPSRLQELFYTHSHCNDNYSDVRGQESAKRVFGDRRGRRPQPADAESAGVRQNRAHTTTAYPGSCPTALRGYAAGSCENVLVTRASTG